MTEARLESNALEIKAAEERLDAALWRLDTEPLRETEREWQDAHADLERLVYERLDIPWTRAKYRSRY